MNKKPLVIGSTIDPASMNIINSLLEKSSFRLREGFRKDMIYYSGKELDICIVRKELIHLERFDELVEASMFIFASRHESISGFKTLSAHTPGNWTSEAKFGGLPGELCISPANVLTSMIKLLYEYRLEEWHATYEVTHHGPYIENTPTVFIEIGSTEKEWRRREAGEIIATVILEVLKKGSRRPAAVAFGGPHYAPSITKYVLEEGDIAIGHISPRYVIDDLTKEIVFKAFKRTLEEANIAVMDRKGLKKRHRDKLILWFEELGVEVVKI